MGTSPENSTPACPFADESSLGSATTQWTDHTEQQQLDKKKKMDPPRLDGKDDDRAERAEVVIMRLQEKEPGPKDFVCVDGTLGADRAVKWAMTNLPKDHRLVMVHGIYAPITGWYSSLSFVMTSFFAAHETLTTPGVKGRPSR